MITIDDRRLNVGKDVHHPPLPARETRKAKRFFWTVLSVATLASVSGNVAHAIMNATPGATAVSATAAAVPPVVLLAGIHGPGALARASRGAGCAYWAAMVMTVLLAGGAFALSFDALRALAVTAGIRSDLAWIWPLIIDLSIAQATLALLALSRRGPEVSGAVARAHPNPVPAASASLTELVEEDRADNPLSDYATTPAVGEADQAAGAIDDDDALTIIECDGCATAEVADEADPRRDVEARRRRGWRSDGHGALRRDFCPSCPQQALNGPLASRDKTVASSREPVASPA